MVRGLRRLSMLLGVACTVIGVFHLGLGIRSVPGEGLANATVDSRERYYGAIFIGYGLAWVWTARQRPVPARAVRFLAGIFLLGAVGRVISVVERGWPHWFQTVLTGIELALPPVFFWLAAADERTAHPDGTSRDD